MVAIEEEEFGEPMDASGSDEESDEPSIEETLVTLWKGLGPPTDEKEIIGKWYAAIYEYEEKEKKKNHLYIGRALNRFLYDENGVPTGLRLDCLRLHVGSGTEFQSNPDHLKDISVFPVKNIIDGPVRVLPKRGDKWDIPEYPSICNRYHNCEDIDRENLFNIKMMVVE